MKPFIRSSIHVVCALSFLLLSACNDTKNTTKDQIQNPHEKPQDAGANPIVTDVSVAKVLGTWQTECIAAENDGYQQSALQINRDNTVEQQSKIFYDSECTNPAYTVSGVYSVKDDGTATETMFDLVSRLKKSMLVLENAALVKDFNQSKVCGIESWQMGTPQNIVGKQCGDATMPAEGSESRITVYYSADKIEVNVAGSGYTIYHKVTQ